MHTEEYWVHPVENKEKFRILLTKKSSLYQIYGPVCKINIYLTTNDYSFNRRSLINCSFLKLNNNLINRHLTALN